MKVICDFRTAGNSTTNWTLFTGSYYKDYEPDELPAVISDILKNSKEAENIYITNLSLYFLDFVSVLWHAGFNPIDGNPSVKKMHEKDFKYLVNGDLNCYSITIKHHKRAIVLINYDNIVNLNSRKKVIDTWTYDFDDENLSHRYALAIYRSIKNLNADCKIEKKMPTTISGYARRKWKDLVGFWDINNRLPDANKISVTKNESLEMYCRKAYHGGLNIARRQAVENKIIDLPGYVLDANSLYSFVMKNRYMPIKEPKKFNGEPTKRDWNDANNGYIYMYLRIKVALRLKENGIPCVQIPAKDNQCFTHKRGWLETTQYYNYHEQVYIEEDEPNLVELTLTQTDYKLMFENYDVLKIEHINYLVFFTTKELFSDYVDEYFDKKQNAKNEGERRISKMMLNGLSGNMARLPEYTNIKIRISDKGEIRLEEEHSKGGASYVYIGAAITSYAREYLIFHAKQCGDLWLYSDSDSVHLLGNNIASVSKIFKIGDGLGEWKIEKVWDKAIYFKLKMYGMIKDNKTHLTMAGIPTDSTIALEHIIDDVDNFSFENLDVCVPIKFEKLEEGEKDVKYEKFMELIESVKEMGIAALNYTSFPVTLKRHAKEMFTENLYIQYSNISDKGFLNK